MTVNSRSDRLASRVYPVELKKNLSFVGGITPNSRFRRVNCHLQCRGVVNLFAVDIIGASNRGNNSMSSQIWQRLRSEAESVIQREPLLASYVYACVLNHNSLESALGFILANKLSDDVMPAISVGELFEFAFVTSPELVHDAASDILAVHERDALPGPICRRSYSLRVFRLFRYIAWRIVSGRTIERTRTVYTEPQFSGFRRRYSPCLPDGARHHAGSRNGNCHRGNHRDRR